MVLDRWRPGLDITPWRGLWWPTDGERNWTPALDIFEKDDKIETKYEDGVLEVSLPKIAEVKPKKVKIAAKKKAEK